MRSIVASTLVLCMFAGALAADSGTVTIHKQSRVEDAAGKWQVKESAESWQPGQTAIIVIPRLIAHLARPEGDLSLANIDWGDTSVSIDPGPRWKNAFTGDVVESLDLHKSLSAFPVVLLTTT